VLKHYSFRRRTARGALSARDAFVLNAPDQPAIPYGQARLASRNRLTPLAARRSPGLCWSTIPSGAAPPEAPWVREMHSYW